MISFDGFLRLFGLNWIFAAIGWGYLLLALVCLVLAWRAPERLASKVALTLFVLALFSFWPFQEGRRMQAEAKAAEAWRAEMAITKAIYRERCKSAGYKVVRKVEGERGVFLMRIRPKGSSYADPGFDDPYGDDLGGDAYIESFLFPLRTNGFDYVEAVNPADGNRYRYHLELSDPKLIDKPNFLGKYKLIAELATGPQARFAVTYEDITKPEERKRWIAGSSLRVIDTQTQEVIGERIGYMMDPGGGFVSQSFSPWLQARRVACPQVEDQQHSYSGQTFRFVIGVVVPQRLGSGS